MRIIICDDEKDEILNIKEWCESCCTHEDEIVCYTSSGELCRVLIEEHPKADLFILDIEMPEITGLELKHTIAELYADTNIVFLTSHDEMMQEAFGKQVLGFIQKGDYAHKLNALIREIRDQNNTNDQILISDGNRECVLHKSRLMMIQAQHIYSVARLVYYYNNDLKKSIEKEESFRLSLNKWEQILGDESFYRVGRNYIINFAFVKKITRVIVLDSGEELHVPAKKLKKLKTAYNRYCAGAARSIW